MIVAPTTLTFLMKKIQGTDYVFYNKACFFLCENFFLLNVFKKRPCSRVHGHKFKCDLMG